jgi:hypothetical protein
VVSRWLRPSVSHAVEIAANVFGLLVFFLLVVFVLIIIFLLFLVIILVCGIDTLISAILVTSISSPVIAARASLKLHLLGRILR